MTAPLSAERATNCRRFVDYMRREGNEVEREYAEDILAILRAALKYREGEGK